MIGFVFLSWRFLVPLSRIVFFFSLSVLVPFFYLGVRLETCPLVVVVVVVVDLDVFF